MALIQPPTFVLQLGQIVFCSFIVMRGIQKIGKQRTKRITATIHPAVVIVEN